MTAEERYRAAVDGWRRESNGDAKFAAQHLGWTAGISARHGDADDAGYRARLAATLGREALDAEEKV